MTIPFTPDGENELPQINPLTGTVAGAALSALTSRTEENVRATLKAQLQQANGWTNLWDQFWQFISAPFEWVFGVLEQMFPNLDWDLSDGLDIGEKAQWILDQIEAIPVTDDILNILEDLKDNPQDYISSVGNVIVDGNYSFKDFLSELWGAMTGQSGYNATVGNVATALGTVADNASQAYINAQSANDLADEVISSGSNLIKNSGFETIWFQQLGSTFSPEYARTGTRSLKITGNGVTTTSYTLLSDDDGTPRNISVSEGDIFYAEVWVRGKASNSQTSGGANAIQMVFQPYNGSNVALATSSFNATASTALNGGWVKLSGYVIMPTGARWMSVKLQLTSNVKPLDSYYFDDVTVREVTLAKAADNNAATAQTAADAANVAAGVADGKAVTAQTTIENVAAAGNLVISPNFEIPLITRIPYGSATLAYATDQKYLGSRSLKFTTTSATWQGVYLAPTMARYSYDVKPGDTFNVSVMIRPGSGNNMATGYVRFFIRWWSNGVFLSDTFTAATQRINNASMSTGWSQLSGVGTAPDTADRLDVFVVADPTTTVGNSYYIDAAQVREETTARAATVNLQTTWDNIAQAIQGGTGTGNGVATVKSNLQLAWAKFWDGLTGGNSATSKTVDEVKTAASGLLDKANTTETTANAAKTNLQTTIDGIWQSIVGGTQTNNAASTVKTNLQTAWSKFWDGLTGNTGSTSKSPADVQTAASGLLDKANTTETTANAAKTNLQTTIDGIWQSIVGGTQTNNAASTVKTNLQNAWAKFWDGLTGNTGTAAKSPADVQTAASGLLDKANTTETTATAAKTNLQTTIDGIWQSIVGGTQTNNAASTVKTNLQNAWSKFWDGLTGNTGSTTKSPADVQTAAAGLLDKANTTETTAGAAKTNLQTTIDGIWQAIKGDSATNNSASTVKSNLQLAWANFWDGLTGGSGSTSKTPAEVRTVATALRTDATDAATAAANAGTSAATAQTSANDLYSRVDSYISGGSANLVTNPGFEDSTQYLWNGTYATSPVRSGSRSAKLAGNGTTLYIELASNKTTRIRQVGGPSRTYAIEYWVRGDDANTITSGSLLIGVGIWTYNASSVNDGAPKAVWTTPNAVGTGQWVKVSGIVTTDSNATIAYARPLATLSSVVPSGNAYYFDDIVIKDITEAYAADVKAQGTVDGIVQAVDGGSATGAAPATTKTKLQLAWANLWDGLFGSTGSTSKLPSDVKTVATALRTDATNAGTAAANAGNAAATAQTTANAATTAAAAAQLEAERARDALKTAQASGPNLVIDGGFENNYIWSPTPSQASDARSSEQKRNGSYSWKHVASGSTRSASMHVSNDRTYSKWPTSQGKKYYVEAWVFPAATNSHAAGYISLHSEVTRSSGGLMYPNVQVQTSTLTKGAWNKISGFIDVSYSDAVSWYLYLRVDASCTSGDVFYWDDVRAVDVTEAYTAQAAADAAAANAQATVDAIVQSVDGGTSTGNAPAATKTKLQLAWANFWDGLTGGSGSTSKTPADVKAVATTLRTDANNAATAATNAGAAAGNADVKAQSTLDAVVQSVDGNTATGAAPGTVKTKLQLAWANFWDGLTGGSGSTSKTPADVRTAATSLRTDTTNAGTAAANAGTAAGTAQTTANTAKSLTTANIASGANLAIDGGIETGGVYLGTNVVRSNANERARTGSYSVKATTVSGQYCFYYPIASDSAALWISASPGDVFYVEAWVYGAASNAVAGGTQTIRFQSTNRRAGLADNNSGIGASGVTADSTTGVWTKVAGYLTMPADTYQTQIYLYTANGIPTGNVYYFDDIVVQRITEGYNADSKAQTAVDGVVQAVDGSTATGAAAGTVKTKLQLAWANLWDGLFGSSGSTVKTPAEVKTVAASLRTDASNAGTAAANAGTAAGNADVKAQSTLDAVVQSVDGGTATGAAPVAAKTKLQLAWANFWDGLTGSSGSTSKTPAEVKSAATTLRADATDAATAAANAGTAAGTAQTTANTANTLASNSYKAGDNLLLNSSFEDTSIWMSPTTGGVYSTEQARTGSRSLKIVGTGGSPHNYLTNTTTGHYSIPGVKQGDVFQFSVWVRGHGSNVDPNRTAGIRLGINSENSAGANVAYDVSSFTSGPALTGVWTQISALITISNANASQIRPYIQLIGVPATDSYYFDDVVLQRVTMTQTVIDGIVQAVDGGSATGAAPVAAKTKLQLAWANLWDGLFGSSGSTVKTPSEVKTVATSLRADATNAGTAASNADAKAVVAQSLVTTYVKSGNNMILSGSFEDASVSYHENQGHTRSTDVARTGSYSLKSDATTAWKYSVVSRGPAGTLMMNVSPGDVLLTEAWVYGKTTNVQTSGGTNRLRIIVQWYTGANVYMSGQDTTTVFGTASTAMNGVWTKLSGYATVPAGASYAIMVIATDGAGITLGDVYYWDDCACYRTTEAYNAQSTANTATTNVQTTVDSIVQAVDGGTATGSAPAATKTKLQLAWANLWDGLRGSSGATSKLPSDVKAEATSLRTTAADASTAASAADTKAVNADSKAQNTLDAVVQAVDGNTATGAAPSAAKTKLQLAWANIWDGLFGSSGATVKTPADVKAAASNLRTTAADAGTAAANADSKAVVAQTVATEIIRSGSNLASNPGFENTTFYLNAAASYNTDALYVRTGSRSIKFTSNGVNYRGASVITNSTAELYIPCTPGDVFYVEAWVRADDNNTATTGQVYTQMVGRTAPSTYVYATAASNTTPDTLKGGWTKLAGYVTVPANCYECTFYVYVNVNMPAGNSFYFDDVVVREVTLANTANAAAGTAQTAANAAQTAAATADAKAVTAQSASKELASISGSNMVLNPSFENSSAYLGVTGSVAYSTDYARTGTRSVKITANGAANQICYLFTNGVDAITYKPCSPGDVFYVEAWVRGAPANTATTGSVYISGAFNVNTLASPSYSYVTTASSNPSTIGTSTWYKLSGYYTAPANAITFNPLLVVASNVANGNVFYFDDVVVREVTLASAANTAAVAADGKAVELYSRVDAYISGGAGNLCTNPGFEDTAQYATNGVYVTTPVRQGARSMKLTGNGTAYRYIELSTNKTTRIWINSNSTRYYYVEFWVYGDTGNTYSSSNANIGIGLWAYNTSETYLGVPTRLTSSQSIGTGAWVKISGTLAMSPHPSLAKIRPMLFLTDAVPANNSYYFDDVSVVDITEAYVADQNAAAASAAASTADSKAVSAQGTANTATTNLQTTVDSIVQAVDGGTATGAAHAATKTKLQLAWANLWDGLRGSSGATSKLPSDVKTEASNLRTTAADAATAASAADTKAVNADSKATTATNNLQTTWNDLFDSFNGTTGSTGKASSDVKSRATESYQASLESRRSGVNLITDPGFENSNLDTLRNGLGTAGSWGSTFTYDTTTKRSGTRSLKVTWTSGQPSLWCTPSLRLNDYVATRSGAVFYVSQWVYVPTSNTGTKIGMYLYCLDSTGAAAATFAGGDQIVAKGSWVKMEAYITVPTPASPAGSTFDRVRFFMCSVRTGTNGAAAGDVFYFSDLEVYEVTAAAQAVDSIHQAVNGGTATGNSPATVKSNLQLAWANLWDGLRGSSGATSKLPADVKTEASNLRTAAADANTAASAADTKAVNADSKAVVAQTFAQAQMSRGANIVSNPGFEKTGFYFNAGYAEQTTEQKRTGARSIKVTHNGANYSLVSLITDATSNVPVYVNGGDVFYCEAWVYGHANNADTTNGLWFQFQVVKADGSSVYTSSPVISAGNARKNVWTKLSGYITVPTDAAYISLAWLVGHNLIPSGNIYYWDDVVIRDVTHAQQAVDGIHQAIQGGTTTGNLPSTVKSNFQLAWANLWDGLRGSSGATSKLPSDVKAEATTLKTNVNDAATAAANAGTLAGTVTTNHGTLVDHVSNAFFGDGTLSGTTLSQALAAMQKTYTDLASATTAINELKAKKDAVAARGKTISVDFSQYSTMSAAGFSVTYSGAGTSTIAISGGVAQWNVADSASRDAKIINSTALDTDFQVVRGTMSAPPQSPSGSTPYFYALARVSDDGLNYVWARAYAVSLGNYKADIGYCVNGTEYTWASNISLTWSLDMRFVAGVGTNARTYQIWSGNTKVHEHVESGTSSLLGAGYRKWGAIAQVRNGRVAGKVSATSASDNATPAVNGSTARMTRTSSTSVSFVGGDTLTALSSFFDDIPYESPDIDANTSGGTFKVVESKPYMVIGRIALSTNISAVCTLALQVSTDNGSSWSTVQWGDNVYPSSGQAMTGQWIQYLTAGSMIRLAYSRGGVTLNAINGDSTGSRSYFSIASFEGAGG